MSDFSSVSVTPSLESRPPWEPRTRFEMEREITSIRGTLKTLSEAVGAALDVLLQTETEQNKQGDEQSRRREALECLDYVREVLRQRSKGELTPLDEERLWGEHELQRRRASRVEPQNTSTPEKQVATGSQEPNMNPKIINPPKAANIPEAMSRRSRGGTLPVNSPMEKLPHARNSSQVVAPWNHTPSSFSSQSSSPNYTLLSKPQPSSLAIPSPAQRSSRPGSRESTVEQDPLGALR
jgi:TBC1 domain family member 5